MPSITAGKLQLCYGGGIRKTQPGSWSRHISYKVDCLPESVYLPVLGFSRLSASSEIAPVVMVFLSLETPEAAATPGFVSMSSLLALFSCNRDREQAED